MAKKEQKETTISLTTGEVVSLLSLLQVGADHFKEEEDKLPDTVKQHIGALLTIKEKLMSSLLGLG